MDPEIVRRVNDLLAKDPALRGIEGKTGS
jgi:hypothetical protein